MDGSLQHVKEFPIFYVYVLKHKILVFVLLPLTPNYMNQLNDRSFCPLTIVNM